VDVAPTLAGLAGVPWPAGGSAAAGPLQIERGGDDFLFDGLSQVDCVMESRPTTLKEAITVTSHNALVAGSYPRSGKKMWSRFGLRTAERRYVWDGLYRMREVTEVGASPPVGWAARLKHRWVETPALWSRLATERASALGPGPKLDRALFPRFGEESEEEEDASLEQSMRMLGYGE
jgi:hypothetical protein